MDTPSFLDYIIGMSNMPLYGAMWFFAFVGVGIRLGLAARARNKDSPETPYKFSINFLLLDNAGRLFTGVLIVFIFLRFPEYLLQYIPSVKDNVELKLLTAFGIGLLGDKLAAVLQKWNFLGLNNSAIRTKIKKENEKNTPDTPPDPSDG